MPVTGEPAEGGAAAREPAAIIGVLGAGTMGSGIAQLACRAGARTLLYDPLEQALERGRSGPAQACRKKRRAGGSTPPRPRPPPNACRRSPI